MVCLWIGWDLFGTYNAAITIEFQYVMERYAYYVLFKVKTNFFIRNITNINIIECLCVISVIRVTDFSSNGQREDKFRIHLYEHHSLKSDFLGTKEISAYLHPTGKNQDKQSVRVHRSIILSFVIITHDYSEI